MPKKRSRRPRLERHPKPERKPKVMSLADMGDDHMLWAFESFDPYDAWCDLTSKKDEFRTVARHLRDLEKKTCKAITANADRDHPTPRDQLIVDAQKRLEFLSLDDVDEIRSFHLGGKERLWGIKDGSIFRALWWDPLHKICPSHLPHT